MTVCPRLIYISGHLLDCRHDRNDFRSRAKRPGLLRRESRHDHTRRISCACHTWAKRKINPATAHHRHTNETCRHVHHRVYSVHGPRRNVEQYGQGWPYFQRGKRREQCGVSERSGARICSTPNCYPVSPNRFLTFEPVCAAMLRRAHPS